MSLAASRRGAGFVCQPCRALLRATVGSMSSHATVLLPRQSFSSGTNLLESRMPASQRHLSTSQSRPASAKFKVKKRSAPSFTKPSFTLADVPALDFWQAHAKPPVLRAQISAEDLHSAVLRYADIALAGDQGWREQLLSTHGISAVTLHYAAALIILGPAGRPWFLATHILHSLVLLGYEPSILTMVRLAWRTRKLGEPQFQPAEDAFHRILSNAKSAPIGPDAATLAGLLASFAAIPQYTSDVAANPGWHHKETAQLIYHGNMGKALEWYRYAARVGGDEPDAWDWQITCAQGLAVCYEAMRQEDRASEIYEYLATTLDHPEGCFLHADGLMKRGGSDPKVVEELLLKAAAGGVGRAASALERTYRSEAARASSKDVSRHYNIMADEWGAIAAASPRAPASEHTLPDSHQQDDGPSQQL